MRGERASMIMLLEESKRYLSYFEAESGEKLVWTKEETPYGTIPFAENGQVMWVSDIGRYYKAIAWLMDKYRPEGMGMVSKVGGINKLLSVGDIMLVSDYIDNTTCRPKSYLEKKDPNLKIRYIMNQPFCEQWKTDLKQYFVKHRKEFDGNIIDSGVYICTDGPGFESSAEIEAFRSWGADIVGHWISPFVYYAREMDICLVSVAIVSNVFHKADKDMLNDEITNQMFGKLFVAIAETKPCCKCECQIKNILECEQYE